jgi:hypothetical protein
MVQTVSNKIAHLTPYQQALDDFGITQLMQRIQNYADEEFNADLMNLDQRELEHLAAILIERFTLLLNGKAIASYLNAIRYGDSQVIMDSVRLKIPIPSMESFASEVAPRYHPGANVRWQRLSNTTDWGIVIGHFYAQHLGQWAIGYLIKLDESAPSAAWTVADIAWETDLEPDIDTDCPDLEVGEGLLCERVNPTQRDGNPYPDIPNSHPSVQSSPGNYEAGRQNRTYPQPLTQRERDIIERYSHCQLGVTPMQFYSKWSIRHSDIAAICDRSVSTVERWFTRGRHYQRPTANDMRHLAIADFLLEHFEDIPPDLLSMICPADWNQ